MGGRRKGATARSRCIVERVPGTNGPSVIKMSPLGNSAESLESPSCNFFLLSFELYLLRLSINSFVNDNQSFGNL